MKVPMRLIGTLLGCAIVLITWKNFRFAMTLSGDNMPIEGQDGPLPVVLQRNDTKSTTATSKNTTSSDPSNPVRLDEKASNRTSNTKILGFADYAYREYALRWYRRLERLGYKEHVIVASNWEAVHFFNQTRNHNIENLRWEEIPYKPCLKYEKDPRRYRRQLFARRWKYVLEQLREGHNILLTDVDNVFSRYVPMTEFEDDEVDVFHAYSTSYPTYVFEDMGFTVCGGMAWLRAKPIVTRFVGTLVNQCKCLKDRDGGLCQECMCDDQVVLNEMLWTGKHNVTWDRQIEKPSSLHDYPWHSISGVSGRTKHRIKIWDRNFAYRAPMPDKCPTDNWVSMPLYVNRSHVDEVWDGLCGGIKEPSN